MVQKYRKDLPLSIPMPNIRMITNKRHLEMLSLVKIVHYSTGKQKELFLQVSPFPDFKSFKLHPLKRLFPVVFRQKLKMGADSLKFVVSTHKYCMLTASRKVYIVSS